MQDVQHLLTQFKRIISSHEFRNEKYKYNQVIRIKIKKKHTEFPENEARRFLQILHESGAAYTLKYDYGFRDKIYLAHSSFFFSEILLSSS